MSERKEKRGSILDGLYLSDGVTLAKDRARENGLTEAGLRLRLKKGMSPDVASLPPAPKRQNGFERGEHQQPYDPTFKARMGEALRALRRALNSRANWRKVLAEAEAQRDACAVSLAQVRAVLESEAAELSKAAELVQRLGPKEAVSSKAERSAINVALHRQIKARESLSKAETQAKGAADRLAKAEQKAASARRALDAWAEKLPGLGEAARPFAPWVLRTPERSPELTAYFSGQDD